MKLTWCISLGEVKPTNNLSMTTKILHSIKSYVWWPENMVSTRDWSVGWFNQLCWRIAIMLSRFWRHHALDSSTKCENIAVENLAPIDNRNINSLWMHFDARAWQRATGKWLWPESTSHNLLKPYQYTDIDWSRENRSESFGSWVTFDSKLMRSHID